MDRLAAEHSPLAFDQPGHGRSGGLESLGAIDRMAEFLGAFSDKLALSRPVLVGHSLGGAVALEYALHEPGRVGALILCCSAARFPDQEARIERLRRVTEGKVRREFRPDFFSPSTAQEVVGRGIMEWARTDPRVEYGDLVACREWQAESRLSEIDVPTLVISAEDDLPAMREQSDRLSEGIPGARKAVIPKAGHYAPFEQPEAVAGAILAFLAGLAR